MQLTSFVGRVAQITEIRKLLADNRLVTLTGAGGAGKTRLAIQVAAGVAAEFSDGVSYVDLAPVTHALVVPVAVARALGLPDQPGRSTVETLVRFVGDRQMLMVLDNCEHLLDTVASLAAELLAACPGLRLLATSREPASVPGEVTFLVPSLSLDDEAIELFADRARRVRPDFIVTDENAATVTEICRRLDGMPLAIELAAARVRALSPDEIVGSLHDRFRLLTGGARTAVRRQQTLRASVDWSHALLTETERILFRRLAAFLRVASTWTPPRPSPATPRWSATRSSTSSPCSSTSHWWSPKTAVAERDTGYSKPSASMRRKSSASPARRRPYGRVTAITTPRWRRCSTRLRAVTTTSGSSRQTTRWTISEAHSAGA